MADLRGLLSRRRVVIAASVCAVIAAGSVTYAMAAPGDAVRYVTATVTRGDVEQTLNLTGSVQQVNQRAAKFTVSGTVESVSAAVGDTVKAGQELARLDTTALQSAVRDAEATLAQAKATLETDQSTESTSSTTATELVATVSAVPSATSSRATSPSSNQLQQQVKQAQQDVSADLSAAQAAMAAAQVACASSSSSPTSTDSASPSATASPSASASPSGSTGGSNCLTALQDVQSTQAKTAKDEQRLQQLLDQLAKSATATGSKSTAGKTAASGAKSTGSASSSTSGSRSATQGSGSNTSSGTGTGSAQGTSQSSAARTITDQAAVTSAQNALNRATGNLAAAVLTSPADGTVASVGLRAGSTAGTSSIIIAATGSAKVTVDVPLARIRSVKVGQTVQVTADGSTTAVSGSVQAIGLLPASSTSTTSYPVTVLVPHAPGALATGSRAKVSIVIATHTSVVIVPNSALTTTGTGTGSISVLEAGVATRKTVKIGAVGASMTEVTEGAAVGDRVVIADRSQALPTNSSNTGRFTGGGGAFVGGGGLGGGGASGFGGAGGGGFGRPGG